MLRKLIKFSLKKEKDNVSLQEQNNMIMENNEKECVIGIDIGMKGGISVFARENKSQEFKLVDLIHMPVVKGVRTSRRFSNFINPGMLVIILKNQQQKFGKVTVVFEDIGSIFKIHKHTMYSLGRQRGVIEGICNALHIKMYSINPRIWQKYISSLPESQQQENTEQSKSKKKTKYLSYNTFIKLFPEYKEKVIGKRGFKDGLTDSALIAYYYINEVYGKEKQSQEVQTSVQESGN